MENHQVNKVPLHADKLLFAQDLVNYMMREIFYKPYETRVAEAYREFVCNAFNEVVREAVYRLHAEVENMIQYILAGLNSWDEVTFALVAENIYRFRLGEGFEAKCFLWFCIELTILAKDFSNNGLLHAPDLAANLIYHSLEKYDMFLGGWDTLNRAASIYVSLYNERDDILTPETSSSESSGSEMESNSDHKEASDADESDLSSAGSDEPLEIASVDLKNLNSDGKSLDENPQVHNVAAFDLNLEAPKALKNNGPKGKEDELQMLKDAIALENNGSKVKEVQLQILKDTISVNEGMGGESLGRPFKCD